MDRFALTWTGDRFQRISGFGIGRFPNGSRLIPDGRPIDVIEPDELAAMESMIARVNPTITAFVSPGMLCYDHRSPESQKAYWAASDLKTRDENEREWRHAWHLGQFFLRTQRSPGIIWVRVIPLNRKEYLIGPQPHLVILAHELFHSITHNLRASEWQAIEAATAPLRALNAAAPKSHLDRRNPAWFEGDEEPAAYTFERFATGRALPFGIRLPWRVRRIFRRILAGQYANHLCAGPEPPA